MYALRSHPGFLSFEIRRSFNAPFAPHNACHRDHDGDADEVRDGDKRCAHVIKAAAVGARCDENETESNRSDNLAVRISDSKA